MKRALVFALLSPAVYVAWWHVGFLLVFASRGDSIDSGLYSSYVRQFLFGPGLEIPSLIQLVAIAGTILTVVVVLAIAGVRAIRAKRARSAAPPTRTV